MCRGGGVGGVGRRGKGGRGVGGRKEGVGTAWLEAEHQNLVKSFSFHAGYTIRCQVKHSANSMPVGQAVFIFGPLMSSFPSALLAGSSAKIGSRLYVSLPGFCFAFCWKTAF